jgi:hypothetical protein
MRKSKLTESCQRRFLKALADTRRVGAMTPMPYGLGDAELAVDEEEAWTL